MQLLSVAFKAGGLIRLFGTNPLVTRRVYDSSIDALLRYALAPRRTILYDKQTRRALEASHYDIMEYADHVARQTPLRVWTHGIVPLEKESSSPSNGQNGNDFDDFESRREYLTHEIQAIQTHQAAVERSMQTVDSSLEKTCAILAGLFVNLIDDVEDVRTSDAFLGLVELPFLQCYNSQIPPTAIRMMVHENCWYAFNFDAKGMVIHARGHGLQGLSICAHSVVDCTRTFGKVR